ncbi:hypothetical protein N22_004 [Idiomarinaceae phage 1N2-2]|uniref:hypothetical protein n=1 Tax=Idiomarinaceae phage 1N2-2 TaxID=1536592 RepID=UPI0004F75453|nr:hypothetical protein N22_004 [Idiomarinaceae phage 1N2-2]AIM40706.1 hypothetical protein N22_004 [Idiomarinaceae phage 1N2-2]
MTPTQQAMCAVIRESGLEGLNRARGNLDGKVIHAEDAFGRVTAWIITIDGHTVTQQEYEQWAKQQN